MAYHSKSDLEIENRNSTFAAPKSLTTPKYVHHRTNQHMYSFFSSSSSLLLSRSVRAELSFEKQTKKHNRISVERKKTIEQPYRKGADKQKTQKQS